ncbi:uridine 5'-monophosphate synthase-like [Hoplias malabaricus]|uniref:uridine 5'-monophosphate synthase-like n=2 Tax=Hoplias malabaricus TaxID=27720 RepID=UPI003462BE21
MATDKLILKLHDAKAVKFGQFKLKSGLLSPIYIDLQVMDSNPDLRNEVNEMLNKHAVDAAEKSKHVWSDPYTTNQHHPVLTCTGNTKDNGTKRMVRSDVCLIVKDVVTSGSSVLETARLLEEEGLKVKDAVVLLDREQGGRDMLESEGITLHPVFNISTLLDVLLDAGRIDPATRTRVKTFIEGNQTFTKPPGTSRRASKRGRSISPEVKEKRVCKELSYRERATLPGVSPMASKLLRLMDEKKSNLCLSADVTQSKELLELADTLGPYICVLKTHVDILEDFSPETGSRLLKLAQKHDFLIFEDRKFADIGNTVKLQYEGGLYKISSWCHMVNAHAVPGPGVVKGLQAVGQPLGHGCLLIAEMSSQGSLATTEYTQSVVKMADDFPKFVFGFISQSKVSCKPEHIHMTPGVQLQSGGDGLGQQYITPDDVICSRRSDIIIVGRGILKSEDRVKAAQEYRRAGWEAYLKRFEWT